MIYFEPRLQHPVLTTLHVRLGTCEGLLLSRLDHRVKNILAVVSAVVSQTVKQHHPRGGRCRDRGPRPVDCQKRTLCCPKPGRARWRCAP